MISQQYEDLVREVSNGYQDGHLEVKVVVTIRAQGEIVHRVTEFMAYGEDDVLSQALDTATKIASGKLDVAEED